MTSTNADKSGHDSDGLAEIFPTPESVVIDGETIEITPLRVKQIGAFSRAIRPLAADIGRFINQTDSADPADGSAMADFVLRAIGTHTDEIISALAVATGRSPEWIGELMLDELGYLALKVLEVNADFFANRLTPGLETVFSGTARSIGSIVSRRSGQTDT